MILIDLLNNNLSSIVYLNILANNGFYSMCNLYTKIKNVSRTRIDHHHSYKFFIIIILNLMDSIIVLLTILV